MSGDRPAVSVIVPSYNRLAFLEEALTSVAGQTFDGYEVIVVNDHPATSADVAAMVARFDDRFRVLSNPENLGPSGSRNVGLGVARGEVVAPLDDDDVWLPAYLEAHVETHRRSPAAVVYCGYTEVWPGDELAPHRVEARPPPTDTYRSLLSGEFLLGCSSSWTFKRRYLDQVGYYDPAVDHFEDWDLLVRLAEVAEYDHIPRSLMEYRLHLGGRVSDPDARLGQLDAVREKWSCHPEVDRMVSRIESEAYFNASRLCMLEGHSREARRYLGKYLNGTVRGRGDLRHLGLLVLANALGPRGYARAQKSYRAVADRSRR